MRNNQVLNGGGSRNSLVAKVLGCLNSVIKIPNDELEVLRVESGVVSEATTKNINSNRFIKYFTLHTPPSKLKCAFTLAEGATHVATCNNCRKIAFTLAEVLITLGVIGVVAALTMPTLIQKTQEQRTVAQLSKVYSTLSQAWQSMEQEYGTIDTWGLTNTDTGLKDEDGNKILDSSAQELVADRLKKYLKVAKTCEMGQICHKGAYYTLSGIKKGDENAPSNSPSFYLNDGTLIGMGYYYTNNNKIDLYTVLPHSKDRIFGKTQFYFKALPYKLVPDGSDFSNCNPDLNSNSAGRGCTAWVLYNKNMDYLHCRDELSWNGKTKCD